jgi:hypothetical protein
MCIAATTLSNGNDGESQETPLLASSRKWQPPARGKKQQPPDKQQDVQEPPSRGKKQQPPDKDKTQQPPSSSAGRKQQLHARGNKQQQPLDLDNSSHQIKIKHSIIICWSKAAATS